MNYAKKLQGESDTKTILQRLDRLAPEEARKITVPSLEVIYGMVNNLTLVMEGAYPSNSIVTHTVLSTFPER